jgi:RNA polymerase sigma factor (sigma-70 family)
MPEYTEQDIIDGCRRNDRSLQEHLYKKYYSLFLKLCARYAKDMHDAEQLMQDGFLKIFNHINDYAGKGSFEGWMRRIVVNTCLDYLKSKYLKNSMQLHFPDEIGDSGRFSVDNNALDKIALKDLLKIIQTLPPMSRTVFNLFVFDGYTHKEIGVILNMSEGTSQWHVNNARKNLQQKIKASQQKELKQQYEQKGI